MKFILLVDCSRQHQGGGDCLIWHAPNTMNKIAIFRIPFSFLYTYHNSPIYDECQTQSA